MCSSFPNLSIEKTGIPDILFPSLLQLGNVYGQIPVDIALSEVKREPTTTYQLYVNSIAIQFNYITLLAIQPQHSL